MLASGNEAGALAPPSVAQDAQAIFGVASQDDGFGFVAPDKDRAANIADSLGECKKKLTVSRPASLAGERAICLVTS